jgi:hypothetical protein
VGLDCSTVSASNFKPAPSDDDLLHCRTGQTTFTIDLGTLTSSKNLDLAVWQSAAPGQKRQLAEIILTKEKALYSNGLNAVKAKYRSAGSIRDYLRGHNIALSSDSFLGPTDKDVLGWLANPYSGYPDLAYHLIFLLENKRIAPPPDGTKLSLTTLNGVYQKAFAQNCDQPILGHSLFILKMIYDYLRAH